MSNDGYQQPDDGADYRQQQEQDEQQQFEETERALRESGALTKGD